MDAPILLIAFNRPNHTRRVLEMIVEAKPIDLFVFRDHWREEKVGEQEKCEKVLSVVKELTESTGIKVHYLLPDKNLGCGAGPMTGISWFFDNVGQGIVMEDDCLAHPDFFPYCEELLDRYKNTEVKFINSTLYDERWNNAIGPSLSYGFSRYMCTGAWASYREVWQGFDFDLQTLNKWKLAKQVYHLTGSVAEAEHWYYVAKEIQRDNSKKSYWDYQIQIHLFLQDSITIHPGVNLISNIGFDAEGTHTTSNDGRGDREVYPILPLRHPAKIAVDTVLDNHCWAKKQSKGLIRDLLWIIYHLYSWRNRKSI